MKVEYHPETADDLNSAVSHYNALRPGLGDALRAQVYAAVDRILGRPLTYPRIEGEIRRCLVHRFPYSILFRVVTSENIRILVIRHHRRHPAFGLSRR
ncbi:MAG: type II toxin-antitoxin system RelE/ParE family toxin [Nevskia sp.]|nr:type II toxin-antitoxin system RelE/ParE family toxin [Nevskia sp.]